jgi:tetratricopeptide (TPR) repeat protein
MSIASSEMEGEATIEDLEGMEEVDNGATLSEPIAGPDPNINYFELAASFLETYYGMKPDDEAALERLAQIYLWHLADCAKGVEWYQKLLTLNPANCQAQKSLGYAYFGGVCQPKNYDRALEYLLKANRCVVAKDGKCGDVDLMLWIAQVYHLRAADKKTGAGEDFKAANEWYQQVLACDPGNVEAKKGRDDTSYEF